MSNFAKKLAARFQNPIFLLAFFAFVYQVLVKSGVIVDLDFYQNAVNILCYVLMGAGIYHDYGKLK